MKSAALIKASYSARSSSLRSPLVSALGKEFYSHLDPAIHAELCHALGRFSVQATTERL